MELFIESSKTDQLRQGATVVIARSGTCLCPVGMLERYLCTAAVKLDKSEQFLFRGIIHSKNGSRLRVNGGRVTLRYEKQFWRDSRLLD